MLSDVIADAVDDLEQALAQYTQPPFEYNPELIERVRYLTTELSAVRIRLDTLAPGRVLKEAPKNVGGRRGTDDSNASFVEKLGLATEAGQCKWRKLNDARPEQWETDWIASNDEKHTGTVTLFVGAPDLWMSTLRVQKPGTGPESWQDAILAGASSDSPLSRTLFYLAAVVTDGHL